MNSIFWKKCKSSLSELLSNFQRKCLDQGITPGKLEEARIIPTHKGGHQGISANYHRLVALTSHIIKVFEKVFSKCIVVFLEEQQNEQWTYEFRFGGITDKQHLRGLGVTIIGDGTFQQHITKMYANLHVKFCLGF